MDSSTSPTDHPEHNRSSETALQNASIAPDEILSKLLKRAPQSFKTEKSAAELSAISEKASEILELSEAKEGALVVEAETRGSTTSVIFALKNIDFIVTTTDQVCRKFDLDYKAFLHPVFNSYSLCYIECSALKPEELLEFKEQLKISMSQLIAVTDDHQSMSEKLTEASKSLVSSASPNHEMGYSAKFLDWLNDGNAIFLGHAEWQVENNTLKTNDPKEINGLFRAQNGEQQEWLNRSGQEAAAILGTNQVIWPSRFGSLSPVHRANPVYNYTVTERDADGQIVKVHSFLCTSSTAGRTAEAVEVPLLQQKYHDLVQVFEAQDNSHDRKFIRDLLNNMPKDFLLRFDVNGLKTILETATGVQNRHETRLAIVPDAAERGQFVFVAVKKERFHDSLRHQIWDQLRTEFGIQEKQESFMTQHGYPFVWLYFYLPYSAETTAVPVVEVLEEKVHSITLSRSERLEKVIEEDPELKDNSAALTRKYCSPKVFNPDYTGSTTPDRVLKEIKIIEKLSDKNWVHVDFAPNQSTQGEYFTATVISRGKPITISEGVPVFESAGFQVISERSFLVSPKGTPEIHIQRFRVEPLSKSEADKDRLNQELVASGLAEIFKGHAPVDPLNRLMATAAFTQREISLLRTMSAYLWQSTSFPSISKETIQKALAANPEVAKLLWRMFDDKFNPERHAELTASERQTKVDEIRKQLDALLRRVSSLEHDRILKAMATLIDDGMVRTNFYHNPDTLAFKISGKNLDFLPKPRPFAEIFVYSERVEGTHLRAGEKSRGGIRFSDRHEDYRTEDLGLWRTQLLKNVKIIPTAGKGAFISKNGTSAEDAYDEYMRTCLSFADNRVGKDWKHPEGWIVYDKLDPYFVVAADKGTAKFSDRANALAKLLGLWLGDATASGGSKGYDHKALAITALGAWLLIVRAFKDRGIDPGKPFNTIGIGDMSGDVFGNGMLFSENINLKAAFDHRHIYIDPFILEEHTDEEIATHLRNAFTERKRLFDLPRSSWKDYNQALMAEGGGIFDRSAKEIALTPQMRKALSIPDLVPDVVSGEDLIKLILKAECDLLYNGGIGTYVKAAKESHHDVGDPNNDGVRVDAEELNCILFAEGGNNGCSQLGRIVAALKGIGMLTDFIYNGAGVGLSDREVNYKIFLDALVAEGTITSEERDDFIKKFTPDAVNSVLDQASDPEAVLYLDERRARKDMKPFRSLISHLVKEGYLDREIHSLPSDEELADREGKGKGLSAPEIAVCWAGSVMWTRDVLASSSQLLSNPILRPILYNYFPAELQSRFKDELHEFLLVDELIQAELGNQIVDSTGITFLHRTSTNFRITPVKVIEYAHMAEEILGGKQIRTGMAALDTVEHNSAFREAQEDLSEAIQEITEWLISTHGRDLTMERVKMLYYGEYSKALSEGADGLEGESKTIAAKREEDYRSLGLDPLTAKSLALLPFVSESLEKIYQVQNRRPSAPSFPDNYYV